jgi:hypothetical protein
MDACTAHCACAKQVLCKLVPRPHLRFLACTAAYIVKAICMTNRRKGQKLVSFERLRELDSDRLILS